jgi:hypothetical protein
LRRGLIQAFGNFKRMGFDVSAAKGVKPQFFDAHHLQIQAATDLSSAQLHSVQPKRSDPIDIFDSR